MIRVLFTTFDFDPARDEWVEQSIAMRSRSAAPVPTGSTSTSRFVDPETTERVTRGVDATRWARPLPLAYRSGDINVEVAQVDAAEPVAGAAFHYAAG